MCHDAVAIICLLEVQLTMVTNLNLGSIDAPFQLVSCTQMKSISFDWPRADPLVPTNHQVVAAAGSGTKQPLLGSTLLLFISKQS